MDTDMEIRQSEWLETEGAKDMWCRDCGEVVTVIPRAQYERIDGKVYLTDMIYECPNGELHEIESIDRCPICGGEMGYSDHFCKDCRDDGTQWLTEMRDKMGLTQGQLEDLIADILEW